MELTPGVVIIIVVVVVLGIVMLRWARRHEAAAPVDRAHVPVRSHTMVARDDEGHALVNWLLERASEQTGSRVADDTLARDRIVQAAGKAMEDLRTHGSAQISLPFLIADARGPRHFDVQFKRNQDSTFELQ